MKKNKLFITLAALLIGFYSCEKYPTAFISPLLTYNQTLYTFKSGRTDKSDKINLDGTTLPMKVEVVHYYDSEGNIVDELMNTKYPVTLWTQPYIPATDTSFEQIQAKQSEGSLPAIVVNEQNGEIEVNYNSNKIPLGIYSIDLKITNSAGITVLPKAVSFELVEAAAIETIPEQGTTYNRLIMVGDETKTANAAVPIITVERVAETPNVLTIKMIDKNGKPFNPKASEINRRPNGSGGFLQTLQDYTNKYEITDSTMNFYYAVIPFPLTSLGNGYNIYYRIPTQFVHFDTFPDDTWSSNPRIPLRIFQPGAYQITMKFPDVTHR